MQNYVIKKKVSELSRWLMELTDGIDCSMFEIFAWIVHLSDWFMTLERYMLAKKFEKFKRFEQLQFTT